MKHQLTKAKAFNSSSGVPLPALIVLSLAAPAVTAIGCSWPGTSHSVRFNGYQTEREMGRLPPLPTMADGLNEARAYWDIESESVNDPYSESEAESKKVDALWDRAEAAEKDENLRLARELLNEYIKATDNPRTRWFEPTDSQVRYNLARDRLDALESLNRGARPSSIIAYLNARRLRDGDNPDAAEVERALATAQSDRNLKDNVTYLRAAEQYRQKNFEQAAAGFRALAEQYPHSEKRPAALFMTAVATMKTSVTYIPASGNSDYDDANANATTDQAWHDAFAAFQRVINEYPRGRYFNDARGWQAYLMLRRHDRAAALARYYRLLADSRDENARTEAAFSLTLVRSSATDDEMERVEKELANEPEAALAYAYHNIYNYSIDPGDESPPYEEVKDSSGNYDYELSRGRNDELEKEWQRNRARTARRELTRTLEFSKHLMASYPGLSVGGGFALRAAQASEELDDNESAVLFAKRALRSQLKSDERREALWTLGVAQHRLRHLDEARRNFQTLLREYPDTNLTEGARRNLAMIAEDVGDIDGALEQYIALNYNIDVAYFVDILMTPEQLAAFIQKHPGSPKQNEFTYALGVRYLRSNRWDEARKTLAQVRTTRGTTGYNQYCSTCNCQNDATFGCDDPKTGDYDENDKRVITPRLVMRDVQTANDLEALERAAKQAHGDEAEAEALYQYASYQYEASSLLFYNPLASPGYWNLGNLAGEGNYRVPDESQVLFNSTQEHDRLARSLKIYLEVAERFPHTRAARDALYTAAVCHERLSSYNPYWRQIYENGLHAGERMVIYADVKATYPNYQLPRGTYGWQPSTRTVNDGPGWAAPPKPAPRLTRRARLKVFINGLEARLLSFWNEKGRRWLIELAIVSGILFTLRIARRNHRRLRARLARHRREQSRQMVSYPWFELFWIDPVKPSRREQFRKFLGERRQEFLELARDRRSRPVLVRSLVSHSLLTGLLLSLIWTVAFG